MTFIMSVFIQAQNDNIPKQSNTSFSDNCLSQNKSLYNWRDIENTFIRHLDITPVQSKGFFRYAAKWGHLKLEEYRQLAKNGSITKDNAQQYWLDKLPYFEGLYTYKYLPALEKEKAEDEKRQLNFKNGTGNKKTTSSSCNNLDFSAGNLSNWIGQWNDQGTSGDTIVNGNVAQGYGNLTVNGFNSSPSEFNRMSYVHELCNGGTDPIVPINRVPPGHTYSLRLGDDSAYNNIINATGPNPFNHQKISNTFMVTPASQTITYWYAVALSQYKPNNHSSTNQPYLKIRMYDSVGTEITCANYDVNALTAPQIGGFTTLAEQVDDGTGTGTTTEYDLIYKDWTPVLIPLLQYVGHKVTITFETSDCGGGGHFGYAYVAVDCAPLAILSAPPQPCIGGNTIISAPKGLASYSWTGPGIVGSNTGQSITANVGGTYSVTMTTYANSGQIGCTLVLSDSIKNSTVSPIASFSATTVCPTKTTQFTDESTLASNQGTLTAWNWTFGDGGTSTSYDPTHTYSTPGTYPVSYTITSSVNCKATYSLMVTVNPAPTSSFSAAPVCQGASTTFINNSAGGISYNWNFGDGSETSTAQSPIYIYASPRVYAVTLTVTNTYSCVTISTNSITVNPYPVVSFSAAPVCLGTLTIFNNSSTPTTGINNSWNFGDGSTLADTSNLQNPTYTYPATGTYIVTLTITATGGCVAFKTSTVLVNPIPQVFVTSPLLYCGGDAVPAPTLTTNPVSSSTTFEWTNSNSSIGLASAGTGTTSLAFTAALNNTLSNIDGVVTITPSLNGCTGLPASYTLIIKPTPVVTHTDLNYCPGDAVSAIVFTAIPIGTPIKVTWINTTPNIPIGLSPPNNGGDTLPGFTAISPLTVATSNVILVQGSLNGCQGPPSRFLITINANPIATFTHSDACDGNKTNFIDESTSNSGYVNQWHWNFDNGDSSVVQNPKDLLTPAGPHTATLSVTTNLGCKNSIVETLTIYPSPVVSFKADTSGCTTFTTTFTDVVSMPQNIVSWTWDFGNTKTSTYTVQTSPSQTYTNNSHTQNTYYTVSLSVMSDKGCVTTVTKNNYITVYPKPLAAFNWGPTTADIIDPTVHFHNESIGASGIYAYNWNFGDIYASVDSLNYSTLLNPIHIYSDQIPYQYTATLEVENTYGCKDSVKEVVIILDAVTFYIPNAFSPNGDTKNEGFKGTGIGINSPTYNMWIFDRWGLMIFHSTGLEASWDGRVNGGPAQQDVYVWEVSFEDDFTRSHNYHGTVTLIR
jgi:gliding motility-associated-like protein